MNEKPGFSEKWLFAISLEIEMKINSWPKTILQRLPFWLPPSSWAFLFTSEPGVIDPSDH